MPNYTINKGTLAENMATAAVEYPFALVENMSYFKCPDCGKIHAIFGESHIDEIAAKKEKEVLEV